MTRLSPHLSSLAFQYWLQNGPKTFGSTGLYYTGGARHALTLIQWLFRLSGSSARVRRLCNAQTLNEQREIWYSGLRSVLLNRFLSWSIIGNEGWLWKALGVPAAQRRMIVEDYIKRQGPASRISALHSGRAIWQYGVDTLDPVIHHTLIGDDNHYYLLCAQGRYSTRCHPTYLTPKAYARLSSPRAFDGIRVHTDELSEVIARMAPHTLTIAVLMDSMDWFSPTGPEAAQQIKAIYKALRPGGRVLLRSAGMDPWYIKVFEEHGFAAKNASVRAPGLCVDRYVFDPVVPCFETCDQASSSDGLRVNMYASTWICHKISSVNEVGPHASTGASLKELQI